MADGAREELPISNRQALIISIVRTAIQAASVAGAIYLGKKQLDMMMPFYHRVEYVPGAHGRLIVNEYRHEALVKTRWATPKEELEYSRKALYEQLNEMGLLK